MNKPSRTILLLAVGVTLACHAGANTASTTPATRTGSLALPRPDAAANAFAALSNGGNPAAAMGAAHAAGRASINRAPAIVGGAGTIGSNGETGNAVVATSANGVNTVGTPDTESIGMRRARFAAATRNPGAPSAGVRTSAQAR